MKRKLILLIAFLLSITMVYSAQFYTSYNLNFSDVKPSSLFVSGGECIDSGCSNINTNPLELFNGPAVSACFTNYYTNLNRPQFDSCILNSKITGNIVNLLGVNSVVTRVTTPSIFGHVTWFSASNDSYIPQYFRTSTYSCTFGICLDSNPKTITFTKKANAIANIGKLNILNIDNPKLPVQVTVPVSISQTVCSAYQLSMPNMYTPTIPATYSDFSANTLVNLSIKNANTNNVYYSNSFTIPIKADTCAGLSAFSWTPTSNLVNTAVSFKATSLVIDNQVKTSTPSFQEIVQTIYPINLNGSCWAKGQDFVLNNNPTLVMTPASTQILKVSALNISERLFAVFRAGAYRDNAVTPMNFESILSVDSSIISQQAFSSGVSLTTYSHGLTNKLQNLSTGAHNVSLTLKPLGLNCNIASNVVLTQSLNVVEAPTMNLTFNIQDQNGIPLANSAVNLVLNSLNGNFTGSLNYNSTLNSSNLGIIKFTNILAGNYDYRAFKSGLGYTAGNIDVNTNLDLFVTIFNNNSVPVVAFPTNTNGYYLNTIKLNASKYIVDANDNFNSLNISYRIVFGNVSTNYNNSIFSISTNTVGVAIIEFRAIDPNGAIGLGRFNVTFTNVVPATINTFSSNPTNGQMPLNTNFLVSVANPQGNALTCVLDFGDGTAVFNGNSSCNSLSGVSHIYNTTGTYTAKLSVNDGTNPVVSSNVNIFVFNATTSIPIINKFTLTSSNANLLPTNLALNWNVTHTGNLATTCNLRTNGVSSPVNCIGSKVLNNYNLIGLSKFTLIAIDNNSNQVLREQSIVLGTPTQLFGIANLIINSTIVPGQDFSFKIQIPNEKYLNRNLRVTPIINCNNVNNGLKIAEMSVSLNSNLGIFNDFSLTTNTNAFKLNVPINTACTFNVGLIDNLGYFKTLSSNVVFAYHVKVLAISSIGGTGTDIVNFMSSALTNSIRTGFNSIDFSVSNNELVGKKLSITMISADLGLNFRQTNNLASGEVRKIQIPLYVDKSVKPGKYSVRISVFDGVHKQTKYSYIVIK